MTDHDELRARALAATPGPWHLNKFGGVVRVESRIIADVESEDCSCCPTLAGALDARYIAAASPDVVLALLDEIAALRAERAWQPIETAPRDGRFILAWGPEWGTSDVAWFGEVSDRWFTMSNATGLTHWMPLPEAP